MIIKLKYSILSLIHILSYSNCRNFLSETSDDFDRRVKKSKILLLGREEEKRHKDCKLFNDNSVQFDFPAFLFPALILQKFNIFLKKHFRRVGYIG